jgi:Importin-beta N-terminal domain
LAVLQLIESAAAADAAVRQAAAVHFKNIVKNGWDEGREVRNRIVTDMKLNI